MHSDNQSQVAVVKNFCKLKLIVAVCACLMAGMAHSAGAGLRVVSLDNCADQYVLGLVPRADILAVSDRAGLPESYYRYRVGTIRHLRPQLETILALHPDAVVRTWGGDERMLMTLKAYGIKELDINDVEDFDQAKHELLRIGHALGQDETALGEAYRLDQALETTRPIGAGKTVLYYTPSGYSEGSDSFVGQMLKTLGFTVSNPSGFVQPEKLVGETPDVFALGFYDDRYEVSRRAPGRNPLVQAAIAAKPRLTLPDRAVACSAWYDAYDLQALSLKGLQR